MKRNETIDICKGIGIILVVLGHIISFPLFHKLVYGVCMPLFFLLSGYCMSVGRYDILTFIKRKFKSLILPFIYCAIIEVLFLTFVNQKVSMDYVYPDIGHVLWFLPVLFTSSIISYILLCCRYKSVLLWAILAVVCLILLIFIKMPYSLSVVPVAVIFIIGGYFFKRLFSNLLFNINVNIIAFLFLLLLYIILILFFDIRVDMKKSIFTPFLLSVFCAFMGCLLVFYSSNIFRKTKLKPVFLWCGENSLSIMVTHFYFIECFGYLTTKYGMNSNMSLLLLLFGVWPYEIIVVLLINRYAPWIVSKK